MEMFLLIFLFSLFRFFSTRNHGVDGARDGPHDRLDHLHQKRFPLLPRVLLLLRFPIPLRLRGRTRPRRTSNRGRRRRVAAGRSADRNGDRRILNGKRRRVLNGVRLRVFNGEGRSGWTDSDVRVGSGDRSESVHQVGWHRMTDHGRFRWGLKVNFAKMWI